MHPDEERMLDSSEDFFLSQDSHLLVFLLDVLLFHGFESVEHSVAFFSHENHLGVRTFSNNAEGVELIQGVFVFHAHFNNKLI